ncbi:MAG: hypothetical protein QXT39_05455 [Conexivisphaerales archaeon]
MSKAEIHVSLHVELLPNVMKKLLIPNGALALTVINVILTVFILLKTALLMPVKKVVVNYGLVVIIQTVLLDTLAVQTEHANHLVRFHLVPV